MDAGRHPKPKSDGESEVTDLHSTPIGISMTIQTPKRSCVTLDHMTDNVQSLHATNGGKPKPTRKRAASATPHSSLEQTIPRTSTCNVGAGTFYRKSAGSSRDFIFRFEGGLHAHGSQAVTSGHKQAPIVHTRRKAAVSSQTRRRMHLQDT